MALQRHFVLTKGDLYVRLDKSQKFFLYKMGKIILSFLPFIVVVKTLWENGNPKPVINNWKCTPEYQLLRVLCTCKYMYV